MFVTKKAKKSIVFILSTFLIIATLPILPVNASAEFQDVSIQPVDDENIIITDNGNVSKITFSENTITITNLNNGVTNYLKISENKVYSSLTDNTVSITSSDVNNLKTTNTCSRKAYKSKTRTQKITFAKIKKIVGGTSGIAAIAAAIVSLLAAAGFVCPGATPHVLELISGISAFTANVMKGSSKHGIKVTLKSYRRNVKGDMMECWKVQKIAKY